MTGLFVESSYSVARSRQGPHIVLERMTAAAAEELGRSCAAMDPWKTYALSAETLAKGFIKSGDGTCRFQIRIGDALAGVMSIAPSWLLGPYLQFLAVLPQYQRGGIGRDLLAWMEHEAWAARQRNIWLCVTGFNASAIAFYTSAGWQSAAVLPDLVALGTDELLMRKRLV